MSTTIYIVHEDSWEEDLLNFVSSFDGDVSGENGPEYTWEAATEAGYESTLDYLIDKAKEESTLFNKISYVMNGVKSTYSDYSFCDWAITETNFEEPELDNCYAVAFSHHYG